MTALDDGLKSGVSSGLALTDEHASEDLSAEAGFGLLEAEAAAASSTGEPRVHAEWRVALLRAAKAESGLAMLELVREAIGAMPGPESEQAAVGNLRLLTDISSMCAAVQAEQTEALRRMRIEREQSEGVPARRQCRGLAQEVALARRESPSEGAKHLRLAHARAAADRAGTARGNH